MQQNRKEDKKNGKEDKKNGKKDKLNGKEDMLSDLVGPDKLVFTSSPVIECKKFRSEYLSTLPENEPDPKQKMIDKIMDILEVQHENVEKTRLA